MWIKRLTTRGGGGKYNVDIEVEEEIDFPQDFKINSEVVKMKINAKKIIVAALASACVSVAALCCAACAPEGKGAHTHSYGNWTISQMPTQSSGGEAKRECSKCGEGEEGHAQTRPLPALSDSAYSITDDTANCTDGGEGTYTITVEGDEISFSASTAAKGHNYGKWAVSQLPSKQSAGEVKRECKDCDVGVSEHEQTKPLPALSAEGYVLKSDTADCTNGGEATYSVDIDGEEVIFIVQSEAKGHKLGALHESKKATCTEKGNPAYYECEVCHHYFSDDRAEEEIDDIVIPESHEYVEHPASPATCQHAGNVKYYTCNKCSKAFDEYKIPYEEDEEWVIPQKQHTKENCVQTPAANYSCTDPWEDEHYHCTSCNQDFNKDMEPVDDYNGWTVQPTGHRFGSLVSAQDATCTEPGNPAYYECEVCHLAFASDDNVMSKTSINKVIPAKGHSFVSSGDIGDPEPSGGNIKIQCLGCSEEQNIEYVGTLEWTGTAYTSPVSVENAGIYYVNAKESGNRFFSIPITKAGKYRVEFINCDATRGLNIGSNFVRVYDSSAQKAAASYNGPSRGVVQSGGTALCTITGEVVSGVKTGTDCRWFEVEVSASLIGGKIVFGINPNGASESSSFPLIIDIRVDGEEEVSSVSREYACEPGKRYFD